MNPLRSLVRHDGLKPLLAATEDRFVRLLLETDQPASALAHYVTHLAAHDMSLLEHILSNRDLVSEETAWAVLLLREALSHAAPGGPQFFLRRLAQKSGLASHLPDPAAADESTLTPSQARAFEKLRAMAELYFQSAGAPVGPVKLRLTPLLIGSSGTGKSHLVQLLGHALGGVRVLPLTVGSWMVQGSRHEPHTLEIIRTTLEREERLIIFIDELDKFSAVDSGWALAQLTELFGLLDRRLEIGDSGKFAWNETLQRRLRENVFIVGAGAWQDVWNASASHPAGFRQIDVGSREVAEKIRRTRLIPDELLLRFSSDWLVLDPYTQRDFEVIAAHLKAPAGVIDPASGEASRKNFRYVEDCLTAHRVDGKLREIRARFSGNGADRASVR